MVQAAHQQPSAFNVDNFLSIFAPLAPRRNESRGKKLMVINMRYKITTNLLFKLYVSSIIVLLVTTMGCQQPESHDKAVSEQVTSHTKTVVEAAYATLDSVAALTERSTLIVIGTVENTDRVINMARDVNDINKPDLSMLGLGQIYKVNVEHVVKGKLDGDFALLAQAEGILSKPQTDVIPSPEDETLAREGYEYIPFTEGRRYLLFLEPLYGFEAEGYYAGVPHPWRFDISNPEQIRAESPASIPGVSTLDKMLADIAAVAPPTPTPVVTVISPLPTPVGEVETPLPEATKLP
jgi:hypothetical protein